MKLSSTIRDALTQELITARITARVAVRRVAARAKVSPTAVHNVENGHNAPSVHVLRAYAAMCELDADRLLLEWGFVPDDVLSRLQRAPELCGLVRAA